ncbi:MAG: type II CRISPR RNA-guided endonuclease Cas9, partial [Alphaproteobacteria bacterium]
FRPDPMELVRDRARRDLARMKGELPPEVLEDIERTGGFLARQLIDTAYLARVARQYLWTVCDRDKVRVVPGRLTGFLRRKWGLNRLLYGNRPDPDEHEGAGGFVAKRRDDHRHHAIDAFVVGLTELSMLQRVSTAAGQAKERLIEKMPEPWTGFRDDLKDRIDRMIVSYRPDHGASGKLHEETAYGVVDDHTLVYRKPLADLNANEIERIRDRKLRDELKAALGDLLFDKSALETAKAALAEAKKRKDVAAMEQAKAEIGRLKDAKKTKKKSGAKDLKSALAAFAEANGIRRVRLLKTESSFVPIHDRQGRAYKAVSTGDNHRVEIYELPDGTWDAEGITLFDACQGMNPNWRSEHPEGRLVMAVHKNDVLRCERDGIEGIFRVVKLAPANALFWLATQTESGNLQERHDDSNDPFRWYFLPFSQLKQRKARLVTVDVLGRVHDPGPPA